MNFDLNSVFVAATFASLGLLLFLGIFSILKLIDIKRLKNRSVEYIEIIPPKNALKTPQATEQLFTLLHSLKSSQKLRSKILRRSVSVAFEVVSTKKDGVRYIVRAGQTEADTIKRQLLSFLPDAKIRSTDDPIFSEGFHKIRDYKQKKHFAFALRTFDSFDQHDPITYISGNMNELKDDEQIMFQVVLVPIKIRNMKSLVHRYYQYFKVSDLSHNKGYSRLFRAEIRVRITTGNPNRINEIRTRMDAALESFSIVGVQTLNARYNFLRNRYREWLFTNRMPSPIKRLSNILSSLEIANIYHFPGDNTSSANINRSLSRTLSPPLSLRNNQDLDFILGESNYQNPEIKIGLTEKEREKHVYIIGGTGNGKTTLLQNAIINDIKNGKGVAVIDPHGDMAEELLRHVPENRIKDVIYFNPDDIENPIGINLLELPEGLGDVALKREKERIGESVVSILRKVFSDNDTGGSRIESLLRNTIYTAFYDDNPTIFTLYNIINDDKFRKKLVSKVEDEHLKNFWLNEFGKAGGMQQVKMAAGVTTKIGRFLFSEVARRIMSVEKSTINFDDVIDSRKILICNFSKGLLGEDTSELFGVVTIAKLQLAALKRARLKKTSRSPFYVYVDEFQNFATPSFAQMLEEARKYKMFMIMAEQSTSQQESQMVYRMLTNVGTVVVFRTGNPADERTLLPFFEGYLERGEIASLPTFNFYTRISAVNSQEPTSGSTILIEDKGNDAIVDKVIESSRKLYTKNIALEPRKKPAKPPKASDSVNNPTKKNRKRKKPENGNDAPVSEDDI